MKANFYLVLKYLHFGCNLTWAVIWYFLVIDNASQICIDLVGVFHLFLAILSFFTLLSGTILGKISFLAKRWKVLTFVSVVAMILCYLIALVGQQQVITNPSVQYFLSLYTKFGLLEIFPPTFLLIFLRGENGDPRTFLVRRN